MLYSYFHCGLFPLKAADTLEQYLNSIESEPFQGGAEVRFLTLEKKRVFDKKESRKGGIARQRVDEGEIQMEAWSPVHPIIYKGISVWVFREEQAAQLCQDMNGRVSLPVQLGKCDGERVGFFYDPFWEFFIVISGQGSK